jgi:uncharacterized protein (TIGR00290 family)
MSWSTGKDSAYALCEARRLGEVEIVGLLTTVTTTFGRVSMHGVRESLLDRQVEEIGLPVRKLGIPSPCTSAQYEQLMLDAMTQAKREGITHIVFGDLFLEELRAHREDKLRSVDMHAVFPLWKRDTRALAAEMFAAGLSARITCLDPRVLDASFAGRTYDATFVRDLPAAVDPCGENGEFHSFVTHGPMFGRPIAVSAGEVVERDGFVFADLLPA